MSSTSSNQFFTGVINSDEQQNYSLIQESGATSFGRPLLEHSRRNGSKWIVAASDVSIRSKIFPPSQVRMYVLKHYILFFQHISFQVPASLSQVTERLDVARSLGKISCCEGFLVAPTGLVPRPKGAGAWPKSDCYRLHTTGAGNFRNSGVDVDLLLRSLFVRFWDRKCRAVSYRKEHFRQLPFAPKKKIQGIDVLSAVGAFCGNRRGWQTMVPHHQRKSTQRKIVGGE